MDKDKNKSIVLFSQQAREQLYTGLEIAAKAVSVTMGPKGRTVLIQKGSENSFVTKDGITVSKSVKLNDPIQSMGARLLQEAAARTNEVAGDGTTTATVLTNELVYEGLKYISSGHDPILLKKGLELGLKSVVSFVKENSKAVSSFNDIKHVGTISANGDENIGNIIAQAMQKVGQDGIITVDDAKGMSTTLEVVEGMQIDRGYVSPYFVTNQDKMNVSYTDCRILVTDKKISSLNEIIPILEYVHKNHEGLLIIAEDIEGEALQGLVLNRTKSNLKIAAIRAPGYGKLKDQLLNDIAILSGAQVVSSHSGISLEKSINALGKCKKIIVDSKSTTLIGTGETEDAIQKRIEDLKCQLQDITLDMAETVHLKARIAKLSSGVAIIKVGGSTELEMIERKYRIEDALNATKAAAEEGIVPGGGTALFNASKHLSNIDLPEFTNIDIKAGFNIVQRACLAPIKTIARNCGNSYEVIVHNLHELREKDSNQNIGWNASNNEYTDLCKLGILDPVKVTITALTNAISVAITFLTLDAVIFDSNQ